jgi:hypothetical protein
VNEEKNEDEPTDAEIVKEEINILTMRSPVSPLEFFSALRKKFNISPPEEKEK